VEHNRDASEQFGTLVSRRPTPAVVTPYACPPEFAARAPNTHERNHMKFISIKAKLQTSMFGNGGVDPT
jgi:hypothetical protein